MESKSNLSICFLFLGMFFLTLISFPIYTWVIGVFFIILFMIKERVLFKRKIIIEALFFSILLFLAIIRFQVSLIDEVLYIFRDAFWGNASKYFLCIIIWLTLRSIVSDKKQYYLKKVIMPLLLIHVALFYFQLITYFLTGNYIDLIEPFISHTSSYSTFNSTLTGIGSVRPTGLYEEPSAYTGAVLILTSLLILSGGLNRYKKLIFISILSMYLSFSTAAIIYGTILLIYLLLSPELRYYLKLRHYLIMFIGIFVISLSLGSTLIKLYEVQEIKYGYSSSLRFNLIDLAANRSLDKVFMANGAFALEKDIAIASIPSLSIGKRIAGSITASGALVFLWIQFGYLGILYFFLLAWWQFRRGQMNLILFLIISLCKVSVFVPLFIMYFALTSSKDFKKIKLISKKSISNHSQIV